MSDFAARLNKLFETVHPPGRKPHTNAEVANALIADGHKISKPYISQLRSGQRSNPSDETVAAFAKFFKVKPAYFFNDIYASKIDHDLELLNQLQGYGLRRLATRAFDLSEESQTLLTTLAEKLRAAEGLPEIPRTLHADHGPGESVNPARIGRNTKKAPSRGRGPLSVELRGIEPLTSSMRTKRATNCATAPNHGPSFPDRSETLTGYSSG